MVHFFIKFLNVTLELVNVTLELVNVTLELRNITSYIGNIILCSHGLSDSIDDLGNSFFNISFGSRGREIIFHIVKVSQTSVNDNDDFIPSGVEIQVGEKFGKMISTYRLFAFELKFIEN